MGTAGAGGLALIVISLALVALVTLKATLPAALLQQGGGDMTSALSGAGDAFDRSASALEASAEERMRLAREERKAKSVLTQAQSELNAYALNLEGMMDAKGGIKLSQFPKEAANLHALIDESLGSADAVAVQMAQRTVPRVLPSSAHQQRLAAASQIPLTARPAFPPKGWTPGSQAGDSEADVKKVMEKLRRVKSFAHNAKALHSVHPTSKGAVESKGVEEMLVQPPALVGALPVRDGELYRDGLLYDKGDVTEGESEADKEEDLVLSQNFNVSSTEWEDGGDMLNGTNATEHHGLSPAQIIRACNSTCQEMIIHSTIGLAFKVAAKCVPECASSKFILDKNGKPLPAWKTANELKEQDQECEEYDGYLQCKLDVLDPVCDKIVETMPQYCPMHKHESICQQCVKMEMFETKKREEERSGKKGKDCFMGFMC